MSSRRSLGVALVLMTMTAAPARADVLLIPFFGVNYGGDSGKNLEDAFDANRFSWGVSLAAMGAGVFGVEADIAYSPDFFGKTDLGGSSVLTAMGNLLTQVRASGELSSLSEMREVVRNSSEMPTLEPSKATAQWGGIALP